MEDLYNSNSITEDEILAREIADALDDEKNKKLFVKFCEEYTHESLIELMRQVKNIPDEKIRKSKGALFTFLVKQDAKRKNKQEYN